MLNAEQAPVSNFVSDIGDKPREKCGIAAVQDFEGEATQVTHLAVNALQHRGQDGAGIAYIEEGPNADLSIVIQKDLGRVAVVFDKGKSFDDVTDTTYASGHVRYGTTETENQHDALQPILFEAGDKEYAVSHNGQLDMDSLHELAFEHGVNPVGSDTEIFAKILKVNIDHLGDIESSLDRLLPQLDGAFSLAILTDDAIYGARDRHGMRPLVIGEADKGRIIASEVCAIKAKDSEGQPQLPFKFQSEVKPGTWVSVDRDGIKEKRWAQEDLKTCIFEYIYLSKADNIINGILVEDYRVEAGKKLGSKDKIPSSMVVPVLGSAVTYGRGYAEASDIPYVEALRKNPNRINPDSDRTFIEKTQEAREAAVRQKFMVARETVEGEDITLIDDSLVRGTTTKTIIKMLKEAGANKVHVRIGSPKYTKPCVFGVNVQSEEELLSFNRTTEEMATEIGADSLEFLTEAEMYEAAGVVKKDVCAGCMGGDYPEKQRERPYAFPLPMAVV